MALYKHADPIEVFVPLPTMKKIDRINHKHKVLICSEISKRGSVKMASM